MNTLTFLAVLAAVSVQAFGFRVRELRPRLDGRIVGGEDANIEDFPYQVSLQYFGSHRCGGSILNKDVVLTAAHCTQGISASYLSVRVGSSIEGSGGQVIDVASVNEHPDYNAGTIDFDVSVLRLSGSVNAEWSVKIQPLGQEVPIGQGAIVTGWGALSSGGGSPSQLQKVTVNHVDPQKCNDAYGGDITARMTCYADAGKDSCQGDSGGPLVSDGHQVGIVSWGIGCAYPSYPGVYTRVADKDINNHITQHSK